MCEKIYVILAEGPHTTCIHEKHMCFVQFAAYAAQHAWVDFSVSPWLAPLSLSLSCSLEFSASICESSLTMGVACSRMMHVPVQNMETCSTSQKIQIRLVEIRTQLMKQSRINLGMHAATWGQTVLYRASKVTASISS